MNINNDQLNESRKRKAERIVDLYKSRRYTQQRIAEELAIPKSVVGKVTRAYSIKHTKELEVGNLNQGQKIRPIIEYDKMRYLDKYNI